MRTSKWVPYVLILLVLGTVKLYARTDRISSVWTDDGRLIVQCSEKPSTHAYDFTRSGEHYFILSLRRTILVGTSRVFPMPKRPSTAIIISQFAVHPDIVHVVIKTKTDFKFLVKGKRARNNRFLLSIKMKKAGPFKVFLDVGHGGYDPGGTGPDGLPESFVNLSVAKRLAQLLRAKGIEVELDRTANRYVRLPERVALADKSSSNLFLGLYSNASADYGLHGITTYYYHPRSRSFARYLEDHVAHSVGLSNDGIMKDDLYVIRHTIACMPDVLIEYGYISNRHEEHLLAEYAFRYRIASAIANAIISYYLPHDSSNRANGDSDTGRVTTIISAEVKGDDIRLESIGQPLIESTSQHGKNGEYFVVTFRNAELSGPESSFHLAPPFSNDAAIVQYRVKPDEVRLAVREHHAHTFVTITDKEKDGHFVTIIRPKRGDGNDFLKKGRRVSSG